ncbi:DNA/RNA non-specific endonuclease [Alistipes sp. dk3620]|uniref:DNA/RNA non-specific endonuclease n=1 Tax=unclassified Alistipes TaxID=2608932 RepID=UPI0012954DE5|nr:MULTISPECIES: DNA/RNA non-specific endonuclease [unclassified Alistipes]MQX26889.1 DNA/RNA non-specific endonuclease [Alistipes sp. dk3620]QGA24278.1 DNA/RNA non-specific endonuclease [Alistipes sp. dk3624]HIV59906.1 DNA/RNA non-specific endonuclease [Candidatus Alistipes pullistercoris]
MKKRTPIKISRQTHWKIVLLLVLAIVVLAIVSQVVAVRPWTGGRQAERGARSGGLPETDPEILACPFFANDEFVVRCPEGRYTMLYDTAYRQAAWVAYLLTRRDVSGKGVKRSGVFKSDPEVIARGWPSAADRDYTGSGFDRGHLLPSADRNDTPQENGATFRLSNVSPQRPGLNRGTWRRLEERVRRWAARYDSLYIVTGGELTPSLRRIRGGVGIPQRFFKTILVRDGGTFRAIAFLIPNTERPAGDCFRYAISVDSLERVLGMDFYSALPDSVEMRVEASFDRSFWR